MKIVRTQAAIYRMTGVSCYDGNPLIEALPPILTTLDACSYVEWLPEPPDAAQRAKPVELRFHELPSVRKLIYLLPKYALYSSIVSVIIRDGYTTRNPVEVQTWQQLFYTNAASGQAIPPVEPTSHRASGIIFSGISGVGKSTFLNRYLQLYPQVIQHMAYKGKEFIHPQLVWLKIDCPANGSLSGLVLAFFEGVDKALGTNYANDYFPKGGKTPTQAVLLREMARIAANYFLGVLIIDELQNLNRAKTQGEEGFLSFLSSLVEHIGVPIIGVGTPAVTKVFRRRLQDARRAAAMGFYEFQRFDEKEDAWSTFTTTLLRYSWLEEPIEATPTLLSAFHFHSQGITAIVIALFVLGQCRCLSEGGSFDHVLLEDISKHELAPLQSALRILRSGNAEGSRDFDDLSFDRAWAEALEKIEEALLKATIASGASQNTSPSKRGGESRPKQTVKKGASTASDDPQDMRSLREANDPHEELRKRGVTPINVFALGSENTETRYAQDPEGKLIGP